MAKRHPSHAVPGAKRGRPPGSPNVLTKDVREQINLFVKSVDVKELKALWRKVKKEKPESAFSTYVRMLEYFVPKLQSVSLSSAEDGPLVVEIRERHVDTHSDFSPKEGVK